MLRATKFLLLLAVIAYTTIAAAGTYTLRKPIFQSSPGVGQYIPGVANTSYNRNKVLAGVGLGVGSWSLYAPTSVQGGQVVTITAWGGAGSLPPVPDWSNLNLGKPIQFPWTTANVNPVSFDIDLRGLDTNDWVGLCFMSNNGGSLGARGDTIQIGTSAGPRDVICDKIDADYGYGHSALGASSTQASNDGTSGVPGGDCAYYGWVQVDVFYNNMPGSILCDTGLGYNVLLSAGGYDWVLRESIFGPVKLDSNGVYYGMAPPNATAASAYASGSVKVRPTIISSDLTVPQQVASALGPSPYYRGVPGAGASCNDAPSDSVCTYGGGGAFVARYILDRVRCDAGLSPDGIQYMLDLSDPANWWEVNPNWSCISGYTSGGSSRVPTELPLGAFKDKAIEQPTCGYFGDSSITSKDPYVACLKRAEQFAAGQTWLQNPRLLPGTVFVGLTREYGWECVFSYAGEYRDDYSAYAATMAYTKVEIWQSTPETSCTY